MQGQQSPRSQPQGHQNTSRFYGRFLVLNRPRWRVSLKAGRRYARRLYSGMFIRRCCQKDMGLMRRTPWQKGASRRPSTKDAASVFSGERSTITDGFTTSVQKLLQKRADGSHHAGTVSSTTSAKGGGGGDDDRWRRRPWPEQPSKVPQPHVALT